MKKKLLCGMILFAVLFTVLHESAAGAIGYLVLGLTLSYFGVIKNNIIIPIIIHMSMNSSGIWMVFTAFPPKVPVISKMTVVITNIKRAITNAIKTVFFCIFMDLFLLF